MTIHPCTYATDRPSDRPLNRRRAATVALAARLYCGAGGDGPTGRGHGENVNSWSCDNRRVGTGGSRVRDLMKRLILFG